MILDILLLLFGVFCGSTSIIFIKASSLHPALLSAYRLLVAAVALTPLFVRDYRRNHADYTAAEFTSSLLPGFILGIHFISWLIGARMTPAANATLIVNMVPIIMPFLLLFMVREGLTRGETMGTVLAVAGILILTAADFNISPRYFWGDVICFLSMLFFSFYLALGRKNRDSRTIWLYVVPLYYVAGLFCLLVSLFFVSPIRPYSGREIALALGLGIVPTILGHSILNYAMKHLRGQVVSILNMAQFAFVAPMAYAFFLETPDWTFGPASVLLIAGGWLAVREDDG